MGKMQKNTWIIRYIDSNNTIQVTADSGCERRLRTTRMAAALWIMARGGGGSKADAAAAADAVTMAAADGGGSCVGGRRKTRTAC